MRRLLGVYDADHTLRGELSYWIGARLGRRHCSLCDITHSSVRERADWRACRDEVDVPFETLHRDEVPDAVAAAGGPLPYVVAETDAGWVRLLGPAELEACAGDPAALTSAVEQARARLPQT